MAFRRILPGFQHRFAGRLVGQVVVHQVARFDLIPEAQAQQDRERVVDEWVSCVKNHRRFEMKYRFKTSVGGCVSVTAVAYPVRVGEAVIGWVGEFCPTGDC